MDKALAIIGRILTIPIYIAFAIVWLAIMPALLFGMLKAVVYMVLDIKP